MSEGKGTQVGQIYYDVTADTKGLIQAERETDKLTGKMEAALNAVAEAVRELSATSKLMADALKQNAKTATTAATAADDLATAATAASTATQGATKSATANTTATKKQATATEELADAHVKAAAAAKKQAEAEKKIPKAQPPAPAPAPAPTPAPAPKPAATPAAGGMSPAALAAAQRNIPAQVTDIVTGLSTGQSPLTVLMQQGGQLKDMFGGVGNAAKALGSYIAGLVTPFTAVAAAAALFLTGLIKGRAETDEFRRSLTLTGDMSGVTVDQLNSLAASMDNLKGVTRGQAAAALNEFVAAGIQGEASLGKFTAAAIRLEQIGGPAVAETAKTFQALARDPVNASLRLNESVNFLTASLIKQIKSLQDQGRYVEAAKLAQNAYADAINQRVPTVTQNVGFLERAWKSVTGVAREAWDAILNVGRQETPEEKLAATRKQIEAIEKTLANGGFATTAGGAAVGRGLGVKQREAMEQQLAGLREVVKLSAKSQTLQQEAAAADATRLQQTEAQARYDQLSDQYLSQQLRMKKEIAVAEKVARDAGGSEAEIQKRAATLTQAIRKSYGVDSKADEAQAYYQALVAANASAIDKINAQEQSELADNRKRMRENSANAEVYAKARTEIERKYAMERAQVDEKTNQQIGDLKIQLTSGVFEKIEAQRQEDLRREDAAVALNLKTAEDAARSKEAINDRVAKQIAQIDEQTASARAENAIAATMDELTRIDLVRKEAQRRAEADRKADRITAEKAAVESERAAIEARNAIRQQVLSIDPLQQLRLEYEQKLAIVQQYETLIAQAGLDATVNVEAKKAQLAYQYQQQRQLIAESEFASQSASNKLLMDSLNSMGQSATQSLTGILTGTMTAADAMRNLAGVVLNEAVGALVQMGLQYIKNAVLANTLEAADKARSAANAAIYTASVTAQVSGMSAIAAMNAFAATAAIPMVGPELAPAAAALAGATAAAIGAPAIATAPIAGARLYGGPTSAGGLYRVNESGKPEMFTAANGNQYMLGATNGRVTSADDLGGIRNISVTIVNPEGQPMGGTATGRNQDGELALTVVLKAVAEDMATGGRVARATQNRFNLKV